MPRICRKLKIFIQWQIILLILKQLWKDTGNRVNSVHSSVFKNVVYSPQMRLAICMLLSSCHIEDSINFASQFKISNSLHAYVFSILTLKAWVSTYIIFEFNLHKQYYYQRFKRLMVEYQFINFCIHVYISSAVSTVSGKG